MADQQDPKKQPATLSPAEDHGLAKEDLVASLEFKPCHNDDDAAVSAVIASVVPQTTLSRTDRSLPGAFRILTTRQAQLLAARNAANNNNGADDDDEAESSFGEGATTCAAEPPVMAFDATVVATAVDDGAVADGVTEVFKAVPIEPSQAPKWPRSVYCIIGTALLVSAVCLAIAFSTMGRKSKTMSVAISSEETRHNEREVGSSNSNGTANVGIEEAPEMAEAQRDTTNDPFPFTPHELFADYDRIMAHMAFISVQIPSSCRLLQHEPPRHEEEMKIHVTCGNGGDNNGTQDAILHVDEVLSLNVDRCEYDRGINHHNRSSATCVIGKNRQAFSFVVYSCGFRDAGDDAIVSTSVVLVRQNVTCADSQLRPFDVRDTQQTLLTGLALGQLCRDSMDGSLAYVSVPTDCRPDDDNDPYQLSYETASTDGCIVMQREDECINNNIDCAIGSYGIRQQRHYNDVIATTTADNRTGRPLSCGAAATWDKSIFGPSAMEATLAGIDAIAITNREFANVFAEDFVGER